jgi:ABC-type branched-subunit amino acid transport system substrate-binding protein
MSEARRWRLLLATVLSIGALVLGACGSGGESSSGDVKTDKGVTSEPCPGSPNKDRGCIYLGTLSDLTEGPFVPLAVPITEAQADFFTRVNANGGIGGKYDVNVKKYTRDNKYNPEEHVAKLREIEPHILAIIQSLGTAPTLAGLEIQKNQSLVSGPATWWSGWGYEDDGLVVESGASYCVNAMNGLDYVAEQDRAPKTVLSIGYPGDYGGDTAAGAKIWGEENEAQVDSIETAPNAQAGNQDAAVGRIVKDKPDVVILGVGPAEMAEIVGKAAAGGYKGRFIGEPPTYNTVVLKSEAAPAIKSLYRFIGSWAPYGADTPAHDAMKQALGGKAPANDGYTYGWIWSYPLKAVLEQALKDGDMTREGLKNAVQKTTVDYEGALPDRTYGGDPSATVVRGSLVAKPDEGAPLGLSVEKDIFTGPTAKAQPFDKPCSSAG